MIKKMKIGINPSRGRKFYRKKLDKLTKSISSEKKSIICNSLLTEKNKIRFLTQLFRWFNKDFKYYKIKCFFTKKEIISELDEIHLSVKIQKAGFNNLLLKLNYYLRDYKMLKRRSYSLFFKILFLNLNETKNKEITLDIIGNKYDRFNIFITTNGYYLKEFYNIVNVLNKRDNEKKPLDHNDILLDNIENLYSISRFNVILYYEIYMPWFLTRDEYYVYTETRLRKEKKYYHIIKERKFRGLFPLKNIKGFIVATDKVKMKDDDHVLFEENFKFSNVKKQQDFFLELKKLLENINNKYKIDSILVYFKIEYIKD